MRQRSGHCQISALVRKNAVYQVLIACFPNIGGPIVTDMSTAEAKIGHKLLLTHDPIPLLHAAVGLPAHHQPSAGQRIFQMRLQEYDTADCGFAYSTANQVSYCPVQEPPIWPALLQLPEDQYTGTVVASDATAGGVLNISSASMLYTGKDRRTADTLMAAILARNQSIGDTALALRQSMGANTSPTSLANTSSIAAANDDYFAASTAISQALSQLQLSLGTAAPSSLSLYLEPAFFPEAGELASSSSNSGSGNSFLGSGDAQASSASSMNLAVASFPLSFLMPNCSALQALDQQVLAGLGEAITNATQVASQCVSLPATWRDSPAAIDAELYCGWRKSGCPTTPSSNSSAIRQFPSAVFDWQDTSRSRLQVNIRVNDTNAAGGRGGPPDVQRCNQAMNLATNAFLTFSQGGGARVDLEGVRDMPKVGSRLQLDFSSLLGPLFFEWLMQLLLPVFVFTLVHEKEHSLRVMMKMQGLPDRSDPSTEVKADLKTPPSHHLPPFATPAPSILAQVNGKLG
ncbi:hypothetical protein ABBQ38_013490 [Trebouxia sp. C0009 RCD-2024]